MSHSDAPDDHSTRVTRRALLGSTLALTTSGIGLAKARADARSRAAAPAPIDGRYCIPTGFAGLDRMLSGGLRRSELIVFAARPSMGVSSLAAQIGYAVARADSSMDVAFFSSHTPDDRTAELLPSLLLDRTPALGITAMLKSVRSLRKRRSLSLVIVDCFQSLRAAVASSRIDDNDEPMAEIARGLKMLAVEFKAPVLALSRRAPGIVFGEELGDRRPWLAGLGSGGPIEQTADVVMHLHRPEYYFRFMEPLRGAREGEAGYETRHKEWRMHLETLAGAAEVILVKQTAGPIGIVRLPYDAATGRFGDSAALNV